MLFLFKSRQGIRAQLRLESTWLFPAFPSILPQHPQWPLTTFCFVKDLYPTNKHQSKVEDLWKLHSLFSAYILNCERKFCLEIFKRLVWNQNIHPLKEEGWWLELGWGTVKKTNLLQGSSSIGDEIILLFHHWMATLTSHSYCKRIDKEYGRFLLTSHRFRTIDTKLES